MEAQLDADIVPADALAGAAIAGAALAVGAETYDALIVPGSAFLPEHVARELLRLDDAGVPVVFVGSVPEIVGPDTTALQERFRPVPQRGLVDAVAGMTDRAVRIRRPSPSLRALRIDHGDADVVMLVNESVSESVRTAVTIPRAGSAVSLDAFTGALTAMPSERGSHRTTVEIELV
ncbi:hypothetical protein, partial [Pedococcus sp. 2YAF34]|uniref:hypothetical protein n=1 Tax=Pedococcus sp. 2YAF34 TaxID=3233032 RepID=UPI003F9AB059